MARPSSLPTSIGSIDVAVGHLGREVARLAVDPRGDDGAAVGLERLARRRAPRHHTLGSGEGDAYF